jgi:DNA-binding MarR family transcriptional regulator/N-acetylglutamate synthase-like GNAT family acetyltransferase
LPTTLHRRIQAVRGFNRFYTRQVGALDRGLLHSRFSLAEARVLYELAHRDQATASDLARELRLDAGYLSRILRGFRRLRLTTTRIAPGDRRRALLTLTREGRAAFEELDRRSDAEVGAMLRRLDRVRQERLVNAMATVERLLDGQPHAAAAEPYVLRLPESGDLGWVVHRHGLLYAEEYGWDERFEGLVAGVVADFVRGLDPRRQRCWIAEREGEVVGSVFVMRENDETARLRLLLVEPAARGLGIGRRLVDECIRFARQAGYRRLVLWTNDVLHSARRIYEAAGFTLVEREPHDLFGRGLVGETWELTLSKRPTGKPHDAATARPQDAATAGPRDAADER